MDYRYLGNEPDLFVGPADRRSFCDGAGCWRTRPATGVFDTIRAKGAKWLYR